MDTADDQPPEETWDDIPEDIMTLTTDEILTRIRLIENDMKVRLARSICMCCERSLPWDRS
jgi:26S proteasome regulatory subunit T5